MRLRIAVASVPRADSLHRCEEEDVQLTDPALEVLTSMARQTTLRYALNMISTAQVLARKRKVEKVDVEDLRRSYEYFFDEKRSVMWLKQQQGSLVFEEIGGEEDEGSAPKASNATDAMDQS